MNWLKKLFSGKQELQQEIHNLKQALTDCNTKLLEKQEHINTTNAYWKKKLHEKTKAAPKKKKEL